MLFPLSFLKSRPGTKVDRADPLSGYSPEIILCPGGDLA
jgi:hypothetical protein